MKQKSEQKMIFDSVGGTPVLKDLIARAELHKQAEGRILDTLPSDLQAGTRFVSCKDGELTLSTDNAGRASQLRFRQHEIMEKLRENELFRFIWKLKVKVQPPRFREKPQLRKISLSKENAQLLKEEARHTKDKKLREVLEKLASHVQN
ncbi:MAG TPA: DciA family protein [Marinobacter sp.]|nr:DciA family protein [Marinobacter sp.]